MYTGKSLQCRCPMFMNIQFHPILINLPRAAFSDCWPVYLDLVYFQNKKKTKKLPSYHIRSQATGLPNISSSARLLLWSVNNWLVGFVTLFKCTTLCYYTVWILQLRRNLSGLATWSVRRRAALLMHLLEVSEWRRTADSSSGTHNGGWTLWTNWKLWMWTGGRKSTQNKSLDYKIN